MRELGPLCLKDGPDGVFYVCPRALKALEILLTEQGLAELVENGDIQRSSVPEDLVSQKGAGLARIENEVLVGFAPG